MFKESTYKILTVLFLIGYNFAPSFLAIDQLKGMVGEITPVAAADTVTTTASSSGMWTWVDKPTILVAGTLDTNWIKWDKRVTNHSGLEFIGKDTFPINGEQEFELGTLKHHNFPVYDAIEKAKLSVTITLGDPIPQTKVFNMELQVEETPNSGTCAPWHTQGNPKCDDRITFPTVYSKEFFEIGETKYVLEITGFIKDGQNVTQFITKEEDTNEAIIRGRLRSIPAKVTICHRTDSDENPYVVHTPSVDGIWTKGHDGHNGPIWYPGLKDLGTKWGDIIPEFRYFDSNGDVQVYGGKNNNEYGLSILENGCVFPEGKVTVYKEIIAPAGVSGSFDITGTGTHSVGGFPSTFNGFKGTNKGTISPTTPATFNVYPGKYTFNETVKEGWIIDETDCKDIVVEKGDDKSCTITNTKASTLTIVKHAEQVSDTQFNFTATGNGLSNFSLVDNDANNDPKKVFTNLLPGEYSVIEDTKEGWDLKSAVCDNGQKPNELNLTAGSNVTCTFTNTQRGSLTIIKNAIPSSNQVFSFTTTGTGLSAFTLVDNSDTNNPSKVFKNLLPGTYSVSETVPSNWYLDSATCSDGSPITAIDLSAGEDITCTFNNIKYGSISGHKYHDLDGLASTTKDRQPVYKYTIFIDTNKNGVLDPGEKSTETALDGSYSFTGLEPGEYRIVEVMKVGWIVLPGTSTAWTIELSAGVDKEDVDFINIEEPTIKIIKFVDTDGDGKVDVEYAKDWTWKLDDKEYKMFGKEEKPMEIMPGTYTISEIQKDGYHVKSMMCDNGGVKFFEEPTESTKLTINSGDKILCRFTNTRDTGTLIVRKEVVNDNGGKLVAEDFSFQIGTGKLIGFKPVSGNPFLAENIFVNFPTGTYSITEKEANTRGYATTYDNCEKIVVKKGEKAVCTIKNDDIAPELTVIKNVINEGNDGTKKAEDFEITVHGKNVSTPTFDGSENGVTVTLNVGEYKVTEKEDTENYKAEYSKDCSGVIGLGEKKTCTITNTGIDHIPSIIVTKTAGVTEIPETGGKVTFTYEVTNTGAEPVEITSLYDDQFGDLDGEHNCKVGTILGVGKSCTFAEEFEIPANEPGDPDAPTTHKNIFIAKAKDDEENEVEDTDDEVITLTPVPSLKLVKNVVHKYNSDTSITAADWTLYATGDGGFNYAGDTDKFRFVKAGVPYTLSEEGIYSPQFEASDWTCTGGELTGSTLTLAAEDDIVCTITNTALPAAVKVYKDVLDGFSKDIFKVQLEDGGEVQDISDTEDADKRLVAEFTGLDAGTYNPEEVELPDGYIAQGCVPVEGYSATVRNGEETEFVCINKVIDPILQIEKSNDAVVTLLAGNEVTYTITVTAPDDEAEGTYVLNNVVVFDIAPAGFKYLSGTWTAQKNGVNIPVPEPTYDDKGQAKWDIGDMKEGDVVVLTYKTKISLLQNPGNYPDIAWVSGKSIIDGDVLGASTVDPLTPFVGTDVTVIEPVETEEGEVLGASITLPVTGASTYLTLGALIMMILGVITLLLKPFKKLSYALLTGLMAVSFVSLLTPNRVLALDSDIKVRIMQPATPTNKSSFNVGFVALDLNNNSITVECYKDAEVTPFATFIANTGNCPVTVSASGTYTFFVKAKSASGEQKSADVTVVVDLEKPAPVIDYSKAGNVIKFKTPNDGKTKKVEIHRSTTSKYTANEGTRVHTMDVLPNTEYSWTDTTAEAGKTYYYALRTVDALGNVSTIVSDPEVVEVPTVSTSTATTTTTTTAATTGEVAGEKDTAEEGEVAGETDDVLEGEDKEVEKTEDEEEKTDIKETAKKAAGKWYIWVIAIVVIGGVAYYVRRQKRN